MMEDFVHALTIDLEEWHDICGVPAIESDRRSLPSRLREDALRLLEMLDRRGSRGTFFVLGRVAETYPKLVEEVAASGHEIASHGHEHRMATETDEAGFVADLDRAARVLEAITGTRPQGHRAAAWSLGRAKFDGLAALVRRGYRYDSSLAAVRPLGRPDLPVTPVRLTTPAGTIEEWPPLSASSPLGRYPVGFALGLRLLPNRVILKHLSRRAEQGRRAVLAVHPWELDPDPPRYRLPLGLHIAHYAGLGGMREKLDDLLRHVKLERIDRLALPEPLGAAPTDD